MASIINASIVTYKTNRKDIKEVVNSANNSIIEKLFIVDNSPTDELRDFVLSLSDKIEYIFGHGNVGYGAGHNIAIERSLEEDSDYHIIINPDVTFPSGTLEAILVYMDENQDIGLLMPKVLYPNGDLQYLCKLIAAPFDLIGRRFIPIKSVVEERNYRYEMRFTDYNSIMEVPSLSGCFMFLRLDIIKDIGGFDEKFFMYCEDFDLCRRINQVSKTVYFPNVHIYHNYEKGSYKSKTLLKYHISSAIKYFNKWGWIFDKERKMINNNTLKELGYKKGNS